MSGHRQHGSRTFSTVAHEPAAHHRKMKIAYFQTRLTYSRYQPIVSSSLTNDRFPTCGFRIVSVRKLRVGPASVRADGDEVTGDRRDALLLKGEGAGFDRLVGHGDAGMLAQVLGPRGDDEDVEVFAQCSSLFADMYGGWDNPVGAERGVYIFGLVSTT
jgi:hypothetical protein